MTLPLLIAIALAVPALLLLLVYAFSKSLPWLGERPKVLSAVEMTVGLAYLAGVAFEVRAGFTTSHVTLLILGTWFLGRGVHRWFRGMPVQFE